MTRGALVVFALLLTGCGVEPSNDATISSTAQPLFAARPRLWPTNEIPVCWLNPLTTHATQRTWVRDQVARTWEAASSARFVGWGTCTSGFKGVRIAVSTGTQESLIGTDALTTNLASAPGASMSINLGLTNGCSVGPVAATNEQCVRGWAMRLFGHALGFAKESDRPENTSSGGVWQDCPARDPATTGSWTLGAFDWDSVMNDCVSSVITRVSGFRAGILRGTLSSGDISGARQAYPASLASGCGHSGSRCPLNDVLVDFPGAGLWLRQNDTAWVQVHAVSPSHLANGDVDGNGRTDPLVDFGPAYGLFILLDGVTWKKIHSVSAELVSAADLDGNGQTDYLVGFGAPHGLWAYLNNSTWRQLHGSTPRLLGGANLDGDRRHEVIADFGAPYGVWLWQNDSSWVQLHAQQADAFATGDFDGNGQDDVVLDLGATGLWVQLNRAAWVQLHPGSPKHFAVAQLDGDRRAELVADFGAPFGIFILRNATQWVALHGTTSDELVIADLDRNGVSDVVVDFGAQGLWIWRNGTSWSAMHAANSQRLLSTNVDGR